MLDAGLRLEDWRGPEIFDMNRFVRVHRLVGAVFRANQNVDCAHRVTVAVDVLPVLKHRDSNTLLSC